VSGFFEDERGVARAGALTLNGFREAGFRPIAHDLTSMLRPDVKEAKPPDCSGGVWVVHCNAPEAAYVLRRHVELSTSPSYRIGYWAWELPQAPEEWLELTSYFHEIWTPSSFAAHAFAGVSALTRVMPHPVSASPARRQASHEGGTRFLTFADLRSTAARKNPVGAIEAYKRAFPEPFEANLVVKLSAVEADPASYDQIRTAIAGRSDISLVTARLSEEELQHLRVQADVLISLHRAEGFGLTVAEAMADGKAVVATGWSGNVEYMSPDGATQLVPSTLVDVGEGLGIYGSEQQWAEPDLALAASLIRRLADDPGLRARLGDCNRLAISALSTPWSQDALSALPLARWLAQPAEARHPRRAEQPTIGLADPENARRWG